MSDTAAATTAPAKATKKRAGGAAKAKKPADHPKYSDMIKSALGALKVRNVFVLFGSRYAMVVSYRLSIVTVALSVTIRSQFAIECLRCSNQQGVGHFGPKFRGVPLGVDPSC